MEMVKNNYIDGLLAETMILDGYRQGGDAYQQASSLINLVQTIIALGNQKRPVWPLDWRCTPPGIQENSDLLQMLYILSTIDRRALSQWFQGFHLHPAITVANHFLDLYGPSLNMAISKRRVDLTAVDVAMANAFSLEVRHALRSTSIQGIHKGFMSVASSRLREVQNYLSRLQAKHGDLLVFNLIVRDGYKASGLEINCNPENIANNVKRCLVKAFEKSFVGFSWKSVDFFSKPAMFDSLVFLSMSSKTLSVDDISAGLNENGFIASRPFDVPKWTTTGISLPFAFNTGDVQAHELVKSIVIQKFCDGYFFQKNRSGRQKYHGYGVDI